MKSKGKSPKVFNVGWLMSQPILALRRCEKRLGHEPRVDTLGGAFAKNERVRSHAEQLCNETKLRSNLTSPTKQGEAFMSAMKTSLQQTQSKEIAVESLAGGSISLSARLSDNSMIRSAKGFSSWMWQRFAKLTLSTLFTETRNDGEKCKWRRSRYLHKKIQPYLEAKVILCA
jgi:hypothetical protein